MHEAVGELFEGEVQRFLVQPADPLAQDRHHLPEDLRVLRRDGAKILMGDRQHLRPVGRFDGCRTLTAIQQGQFSEDLPGPQGADDLLLPVVCSLADVRAPGDDHVKLVGAVPLKEHRRVRVEALALRDPAELLELLGSSPLKYENLRELFHALKQDSTRGGTPTGGVRPNGMLLHEPPGRCQQSPPPRRFGLRTPLRPSVRPRAAAFAKAIVSDVEAPETATEDGCSYSQAAETPPSVWIYQEVFLGGRIPDGGADEACAGIRPWSFRADADRW